MKHFGKSKDGVIDKLLRAYVSRPNPEQACPEFDPDLANSYVERSLTPGSRAHYEAHLSECGECRKGVAVLVRLYEADNPASAFSERSKHRPTWFSGAKQVFGLLSRPQWAIAAAAVIVLAISLPVLLSRNESHPGEHVAYVIDPVEQPNVGSPSAIQPALATPVASPKPASANSSSSSVAPSKAGEKREGDALAIGSSAAVPTDGVQGGAGGKAEQSQKPEAKGVPQSGNEVQVTAQSRAFSQAPAQAGAAPGSQVAKKESDQDSRQQQGKDSAQQSADAKQDRAGEPRDKEKTARAEEAAAPPAPASPSETARGRVGSRRSPAKLALRDSATTESVRPVEPQKKIGSKRFQLRDNTWTDKDFDPGKDLPVVTIIRDSNVYKEELAKRAGLKPYVEGFAAAERAIIVYKGTVYKLIPQ
jgi:hypothetical protein